MAVTFTVDIVNTLLSLCYLYENGGGKHQVFGFFFCFFFLNEEPGKAKVIFWKLQDASAEQRTSLLRFRLMTHISSPFLCLKSSIEVLVRHNFSLLLRKEKIKVCVRLVCFLGADFFFFFFLICIAWSILSWHNRRKKKIQVNYIVLQSLSRGKKKPKS